MEYETYRWSPVLLRMRDLPIYRFPSREVSPFILFRAISTHLSVLSRKIDNSVPSVVIGNSQVLLSMMIAIPFLAFGFPKETSWDMSLEHIVLFVIASFTALGQMMLVRAFQIGPPVVAAMTSLTKLIFTSIAGVILFSEKMTVLRGLGGLLLCSSILLVIWSRDRARRKRTQESLPDIDVSQRQ